MEIASRSDIAMAGTAVREWDISDDQRAEIIQTLMGIAKSSPKERHQIAACRELSRMVQTNVAARPKTSRSFNLNIGIEEKRDGLKKRLEALSGDRDPEG